MRSSSTKKIVLSGLFVGLGLLLPFFILQIPSLGSRFLPMHIPILIAGFVLGAPYGLAVGLVTPLLRSLLFGMPPMFPTAIAMSFELATYGFITGLVYNLLPKKNVLSIYATLFLAMIGGRIVWGAVSYVLFGLNDATFTMEIFIAGAFLNAIPGIIIQVLLIPVLILALKRANVMAH